MNIFEFLKPKTGLAEAAGRAKKVERRMNELLRQDVATFKKGLVELGLREGSDAYNDALKIYESAS